MELPDFEDMVRVADEIYRLSLLKSSLELRIKLAESDVFIKTSSDERYFQNGKPPSVAFIENTYKQVGLDNEIRPLREELVRANADLDRAKNTLDLLKTQIEVWRSEQANNRVITGVYP